MEQVAIVILNYNGKHFLEKFLPSVIQYSQKHQIVIADNHSSDESIQFLQETYPEITLIQMLKNTGFAGGYNEALKQVQSKYYILLNSDIEVTANWVGPMLALMESDSQIAACQPKIKSYQEPNFFEYAGAAGGFLDKWGYAFCRGRIFDTLEKDENQYNDTQEIFWATGACLMIQASLFHQLGGFDADFFAHMEEIDLCWRLQGQGYKVMYQGQSEVFHVGGGTLPQDNPKKLFLNFRNNWAMLYKNLPKSKLYAVLFIRLILDKIALLRFILKGQFQDANAILKAYLDFWENIKSWKKKRKKVQNQSKQVVLLYPKSIIWEYFIKGKKYFSDLKEA